MPCRYTSSAAPKNMSISCQGINTPVWLDSTTGPSARSRGRTTRPRRGRPEPEPPMDTNRPRSSSNPPAVGDPISITNEPASWITSQPNEAV